MFIDIDGKFVYFPVRNIICDVRNLDEKKKALLIEKYNEKLMPDKLYFGKAGDALFHPHTLDWMLPTSCGINLTNRCQLRCNYCSYSSGECGDQVIDIADAYVFVDFILKNTYIKKKVEIGAGVPKARIYLAGGGEPSYEWELLKKLVEYIKTRSYQYRVEYSLGITTNLIASKDQVQYLINNFDDILVSYDGISYVQNNNRSSEKIRNSASIVERNLSMIDSFSNANYSIRTTIWPKDYSELLNMADNIFCNYSNVRSWAIEPVWELGRAKKDGIFSKGENGILNVDFTTHYLSLKSYAEDKYNRKVFSSMFKNNYGKYNCGTAFGENPWLNADGRIYTCLDTINQNAHIGVVSNGRIDFFSARDILNENHLKAIPKICDRCVAMYFCGSGCPLKNQIDLHGNRINISSAWECEQKQRYWMRAIHILLENGKYEDMSLKLLSSSNSGREYEIVYT